MLNTRATDHITPFLHLLQDVQTCTATLQLHNGATAIVSHTGNLTLNSSITLTNVLCVPSFNYNLLSISKLIQDTPYQVNFLSDVCYLQDHTWKKALVLGRRRMDYIYSHMLNTRLKSMHCYLSNRCSS